MLAGCIRPSKLDLLPRFLQFQWTLQNLILRILPRKEGEGGLHKHFLHVFGLRGGGGHSRAHTPRKEGRRGGQ